VQKNHLLIFSSFLDIWENVEWPRFFGPPCIDCLKQFKLLKLTVLGNEFQTFTMRSASQKDDERVQWFV